ncbi:type II toxin-antitoxin system RelE/ParE family toxin [Pseudomonas sp. H1h]|uniref:type II toxin-antitoxin system RelE family toxin n=1 Tax=Pseudomonas sp. H1h TaxID=1397280 RepID=UPI0009DEE35B
MLKGQTYRPNSQLPLAGYQTRLRIEANRLRELPDCYRVKLKNAGYRLIYEVIDHEIVEFVVSIGKREREAAYDAAQDRLSSQP